MAPIECYERFLSGEARRFTHASLAALINRFSGVDDVISLAGGLPPAAAFPLERIDATTRTGLTVSLGEEGQLAYLAQQYNFNPQGHTPLLASLRDLTQRLHGVPVPAAPAGGEGPWAAKQGGGAAQAPAGPGEEAAGDAGAGPAPAAPPAPLPPRDLVLCSGAIHGIFAAIACLTDPGDTLVVDEYTYTHALECVFLPRDLRLLPVRGDEQGMDPADLEAQLRAVAAAAASGGAGGAGAVRAPRLAYVIPTGHNPTGAIMGEGRKRELLQVASRHDLMIIEDDAYWWLTYPQPGSQAQAQAEAQAQAQAGPADAAERPQDPSLQAGLGGLPRSLLSLDGEGRVLRVDTFSKLLGPGYRLGWLTAPLPLVPKLANWVMGSTVGPCSVTQVLVHQLLQRWGWEGFDTYLRGLQASRGGGADAALYASRAAAAHAAALEHLGPLGAEWRQAHGGMFMWIRLPVPDVGALLDSLVAARVVVAPGGMFATRGLQATLVVDDGRQGPGTPAEGPGPGPVASPFLRLSFAGLPPAAVAEGMRRLAGATREALAGAAGEGGAGGAAGGQGHAAE
ncbi:hypothetical protein HYH03_010493 [Edaphochlamys debaryana]|uniref:Aminotransferase class I/classII large domain-containing protein n=1 Tax=Edaphochlamys debaryana TaxID=47281 RepID=A0A835XWR5_9CHLO|nr:hypothetical protein HYH03_010493 [Edaphochlamys debaryana]|eukprot:KAG2491047.1 hypothetical protein HYH03_010493 [Edaphochlamys debaryana]